MRTVICRAIGRSLPLCRVATAEEVKTPSQTVRADFPHTAYGWPLGSLHYAVSWCRYAARPLTGVTPRDRVLRLEAPALEPLGRGPQSPLRLSHFAARLKAAGVVRSGLAGHSLALTRSSDVTTPGTLPSHSVIRRCDRRYYDPLGLPLDTPRFRLRLIRARSPRRRPPRRASRVPYVSLPTCCAPYPAGT
jgi:hypothetical protein